MISDEAVRMVSCTTDELELIKSKVPGLGSGETEALGVVDRCVDRTFKYYIILTDDIVAQKQATRLGMNSLDIASFLFLANQKGAVSKRDVTDALEVLVDLEYCISPDLRDDFLLRLR